MLRQVARQLDDWIAARNRESRSEGLPTIHPCHIRLFGQTALLETGVRLTLAATRDVDVTADYESAVEAEFRRLLKSKGRELDPLGHEIWMPKETQYSVLYAGQSVELTVADPEAVLVSKALKAPEKNRALLVEYLARGPSKRFLTLSKKYRVNLEQFV
jgi:hypothetical protein